MAVMFRELAENYTDRSSNGVRTITQCYIRDDERGTVAQASLPVEGVSLAHDVFSAATTCICTGREWTLVQRDKLSAMLVCVFSGTTGGYYFIPVSRARDGLQEVGECGGKITGINDPQADGSEAWKWSGGSLVRQPVFVSQPSGSFRKILPKPGTGGVPVYFTEAEKTALITNLLANYVGRVNSAVFVGFPVGDCLFESFSWIPVYAHPTSGVRSYQFELVFAFLTIPGVPGDAWQKILKIDGTWDTPLRGVDKLYKSANFVTLFT